MDSPSVFVVSPDAPMLESTDAARCHILEDGNGSLHDVPVKEAESNGESPPILSSQTFQRKRQLVDAEGSKEHVIHDKRPLNSTLPFLGSSSSASAPTVNDTEKVDGPVPAFIFLPSRPTEQEWAEITAATKTGFAVTGSAATGKVGPVVGLVDIGECEDSYVFRVALPGVKRDSSDFSCEVDPIGKVLIKGVTTTGEKTVYKYSQVFEMQTQNLCPPGHFSVSFQLPGPVDPEQFSGNYGVDGILEGIVMKENIPVDIQNQYPVVFTSPLPAPSSQFTVSVQTDPHILYLQLQWIALLNI